MTSAEIEKQLLRAWEETTWAAGALADSIKALREDPDLPARRGDALHSVHLARKHNTASNSLLAEPISTLAKSLQTSPQ